MDYLIDVAVFVGVCCVVNSMVLVFQGRTSQICMADYDRMSCTCRYRTEPAHRVTCPRISNSKNFQSVLLCKRWSGNTKCCHSKYYRDYSSHVKLCLSDFCSLLLFTKQFISDHCNCSISRNVYCWAISVECKINCHH